MTPQQRRTRELGLFAKSIMQLTTRVPSRNDYYNSGMHEYMDITSTYTYSDAARVPDDGESGESVAGGDVLPMRLLAVDLRFLDQLL